MRRTGTIAAGALALLVVAGAVVAATTGDVREASGPVGDEATATREPALGAAPGEGSSAAFDGRADLVAPDVARGQAIGVPPSPGGTVDPAGPRVVRTAELAIEVDEGRFGAAFDRVAAIAASHNGYVTSSSTSSAGTDAKLPGGPERANSGHLTLRVPSDRFEEARAALRQVGTVGSESLRGEDVGGQLVDYDARLRSLQAQEESLQTLVGRATNVGEVMQVQSALFSVRQQIEQLQAQRNQLEQAASLATISVSVYEPGAGAFVRPQPEPATGLARSFERAVDGSVAVVGGMIVVVGYLAPLAVLALVVWGVVRLRRRPTPPVAPAA
ncbi:MAG: DUF4349 domain-containing protein [Actinomycetota bacterium]